MDFQDRPDFETDNEYQAYIVACLVCNVMPGLDADNAFEIVLACFDEYGGFNAQLAAEVGATLRMVGMSGSSKSKGRH